MADITKCSNEDCIMKQKCYRYTAPSSIYWQAVAKFVPKRNHIDNFKCDLFWENDKRVSKNI